MTTTTTRDTDPAAERSTNTLTPKRAAPRRIAVVLLMASAFTIGACASQHANRSPEDGIGPREDLAIAQPDPRDFDAPDDLSEPAREESEADEVAQVTAAPLVEPVADTRIVAKSLAEKKNTGPHTNRSSASPRKDDRAGNLGGRGRGVGRNKGGGGLAVASSGDGSAYVAVPPGGSAVTQPSLLPEQLVQTEMNTESYAHIAENAFKRVADDPLSTFSIDVDTASYSNMRRFLMGSSKPPADSVRIEEMINYFSYAYPEPQGEHPFSVSTEVASCPWNSKARLVRVGIKGKTVAKADMPPRNLVFLIDVSGSMESAEKLPLLKQSLGLLIEDMRPEDHVSMVVYAGASGVVLEPTSGRDKQSIRAALDRLSAGGSTNGGAGIELAYKMAQRNFQRGAINRVILASDGDFNVGTTSHGDLVRLIEEKRESGVFLSVLGFGTGNVKDSTMEMLADKGNGNYAYIDGISEGRKVLVDQAAGTMMTIAKDVKIQIEFNPEQAAAYRLVGYENRKLAHEDFNDDRKDAGEIGAGHTVTALYEVLPVGYDIATPGVDALRYQKGAGTPTAQAQSDELMHVKLRYKQPEGATSKLLHVNVVDKDRDITQASTDLRFAASIAMFGMKLRDSEHAKGISLADVYALASGALGKDPGGLRLAHLGLIKQAAAVRGESLQTQAVATHTTAVIAK